MDNITSVIKDFIFFAEEKWKIASDKGGSGNMANIGSIQYIDDIILMIFCKGMACLKILANKFLMNIGSIKAC
ncbi:type II restriction endonuclease [Helicobacter pylori]|uniref:type II restriction endonuclease n=1 Tax=Helicobacter pylori TaxID=210 RepID=UPI003F8DF515